MIRIVLAWIFIAFGTSAYCQMYKWVDKEGKVHYSDKPPPQGANQQIPAATPSQARPIQGAGVVVKCQADFAPLGPGIMAVQITRGDQGRLQAQINGAVSNQNVKSDEYGIRENLNMKTDPYSQDARNLNPAENSLVHLQSLIEDKDLRAFIKIPFDLKQVRKMTIYDLQGRQDKFGGTVLMEAYNREGKLLGRVLRSVFASGCY